MRTATVAVVAWFVTLAAFGGAQAPSPPQFRALANFVEVDVSVLDRDRRPVRGLSAADFTVTENGQPQEILTFTEINVPTPVEPPTPWMREIAPDVKANITATDHRLVILVLDDAQVRATPRMNLAVKDIGRRVVDQLGPGDLAAVIFTRNNRNAQNFTDDRARLLAAVDKFQAGFSPSAGRGDYSTMYFYRQSIGTLRGVAEYMATVPQRRKALIYVSPGVPIDLEGMDNLFGDRGILLAEARAIFEQAQRANVNIYSIDPSGLGGLDGETRDGMGLGAGDMNPLGLLQDFLASVATNTGGVAILNRNEFAEGVTQIFRENGSYYLLGYRSPDARTDGKLRKIQVRVNRPDVTVRARNGYYAPEAERAGRAGSPSSMLTGALASVLPKADVAMQAAAAPFVIPGKSDTTLAIALALRQPMPRGADRISENVDLVVAAFGPEGERKGAQRFKAALTLRPNEDEYVVYELLTQFDLKPGRYQLRFAAESSMQAKAGSLHFDVDVPDFSKPLVLSGAVVSVSPNVVSAPKDRLAKILPVVPTTRREFRPGDAVSVFLRVHQGGRRQVQPVTLRATITDDAGRSVFDRPETIEPGRFDRARAAEYTLSVPVDSLRPGQYLLTLEATTAGQPPATRDVRFTFRGQ